MWISGLVGGLVLSSVMSLAPEHETTVAVLPLVVEGKLPAHYIERLHGRLTQGLARSDLQVISVPADEPLSRCTEADCFAQHAPALGADFILRSTVQAKERDYELSVELIDASSGVAVATRRQSCQLCGLGEAEEVLADQAAALQTRIATLVVGPPSLRVITSPPGAVVFVDGEAVGTTPLERVVKPGRHWVRVGLSGYASQEAPAVAVAGTEALVEFELDGLSVPNDEPASKDRFPTRAKVGWTLLGVGAAAVGAGITLIAVDGRPNRLACSGDDVDADGDCRLLMQSRWPGVGVTVAGAVTAAAGLGLALSGRRRERGNHARLVLGLGPSMALRGRF